MYSPPGLSYRRSNVCSLRPVDNSYVNWAQDSSGPDSSALPFPRSRPPLVTSPFALPIPPSTTFSCPPFTLHEPTPHDDYIRDGISTHRISVMEVDPFLNTHSVVGMSKLLLWNSSH